MSATHNHFNHCSVSYSKHAFDIVAHYRRRISYCPILPVSPGLACTSLTTFGFVTWWVAGKSQIVCLLETRCLLEHLIIATQPAPAFMRLAFKFRPFWEQRRIYSRPRNTREITPLSSEQLWHWTTRHWRHPLTSGHVGLLQACTTRRRILSTNFQLIYMYNNTRNLS